MQSQIRRMGFGLLIAFLLVFAQLNYVQFFAADRIASNRANPRALIREYAIKRGDILSLDGEKVATSVATKDRLKYRRSYPMGELFGQITGYYSVNYGTAGIESSYNDQLLGDSGTVSIQDIQDRFSDTEEQGNRVRLTVDSRLQTIAKDALGDQRGAIVALDPTSGEVRALWSNPSYDPTPLGSHDSKEQKKYWNSLDPTSSTSPLIDLGTQQGYPPGSTFKVVTLSAGLDSGRYNPRSTFPDPAVLEPCSTNGGDPPRDCIPQTNQPFRNFSHTTCAGGGDIDLTTALIVSCDTTFAIMGMEIPDEVYDTANRFGFNEAIPFDVRTEASRVAKPDPDNVPFEAYGAIGQGDTVATPLQMALVAAGVANGGDVPKPRLVREIIDPSGGIVDRPSPESLGSAMSPETAEQVKQMMIGVVRSGTGTAAQIPGIDVAGKTGTAQTVKGANPHTWFICFAPADDPQLAVAVIVEHGGSFGSEATGGAVAAPIAR
ncbi:MAG TPA: penicillin-binding transpeptidase domain-containing protein, partial [Actinomycetota bacterium]|nr:penicillin-binding transpeptidase domain-containing protein [Actinomycetota bacterium]